MSKRNRRKHDQKYSQKKKQSIVRPINNAIDSTTSTVHDSESSQKPKVAIFFDTNKLEARITGSKCGELFLAEIKASSDFYDIKKYIDDSGVSKVVELCISEISLRECKQHLIENFKDHRKNFCDRIDEYKRSFGSILDVSYEFRKNTVDEFKEHVDCIYEGFIIANQCKIIEYVRDVDFFGSLIEKAIRKQSPFINIGANGKQYKDAGFKDAIVGESIIRYHRDNNCKCILISEDKDFENAFSDYSEIIICKNFIEVKELLFELLGVTDSKFIENKFETDPYLQEKLIRETGNIFDEAVSRFKVINILSEEEDIYSLKIQCVINEVIYEIKCRYESTSNEVFDVTYKTTND